MRAARAHGVKVVLNGHGSDEILAGYHKYFVPPLLADFLLSGQLASFLRAQKAFRGTDWAWPSVFWHLLTRVMRPAFPMNPLTPRRFLERLHGAAGVFAEEDSYTEPTPPNGIPRDSSALDAELWFEFTIRSLPRWLRMEDRMSMACSVESRLPFMDYRLVEFAFRLPRDLKLRDGYNKFILRQAMKGLLPERIVEQRTKLPFQAPYSSWLRGAWRPMIADLLLGSPRVGEYLNYPSFRTKLQAFLKGNNRALPTFLVWRVLNTELWLRAFSTEKLAVRPQRLNHPTSDVSTGMPQRT